MGKPLKKKVSSNVSLRLVFFELCHLSRESMLKNYNFYKDPSLKSRVMAACLGEACDEGCFGVKIQRGLSSKVCFSLIYDAINY